MKYLRKYNESAFVGTSPMKSDIQDILLELKDEGFEAFVQIRVEGKNEWCKVEISSENKFDYSIIEETIERIKDYMTENNFYVYDFTNFLRQDEKIPDIKVNMNRQFNRAGNNRWTDRSYFFEITFKNIPSTNEELKSDTYKSAADKLSKMGHIKRPEELMKWHAISKQREADAKKLEVLNDCKQMGVYQLYLGYSKGGNTFDYKGDFYINLVFDPYDLDERYSEWKEGENNLWVNFSFGIIPVNEDGKKFCEEVIKPIIGTGGDQITYWLGAFWLNISRTINPDIEGVRFRPIGKGYFEEYEGKWHLSNRASAIKFKNTLYKIFNGDIIVRETSERPGGMKEEIIDNLCNEKPHDIDEYEDIMNSIKGINLNNLYKD